MGEKNIFVHIFYFHVRWKFGNGVSYAALVISVAFRRPFFALWQTYQSLYDVAFLVRKWYICRGST